MRCRNLVSLLICSGPEDGRASRVPAGIEESAQGSRGVVLLSVHLRSAAVRSTGVSCRVSGPWQAWKESVFRSGGDPARLEGDRNEVSHAGWPLS